MIAAMLNDKRGVTFTPVTHGGWRGQQRRGDGEEQKCKTGAKFDLHKIMLLRVASHCQLRGCLNRVLTDLRVVRWPGFGCGLRHAVSSAYLSSSTVK